MLKIGDFSKLSRITIRMLRHYDEIGLLKPENTDEFTGYRYYLEEQLIEAGKIVTLKSMGFSLMDIKGIIGGDRNPDKLTVMLKEKKVQVQGEIKKETQKLVLLDNAMKSLRKDNEFMKYDVSLKVLPERKVASVRKVIPTYWEEGRLWKVLMEEIQPLNVKDSNPCYALAVFHDTEHKDADVDVEVQKTIEGDYENTKNVVFKTEPRVEIASATFKGSYENISEVNQAVANWIKANKYELTGPSFSIYHASPYETENPDEYVTEICYPVKKK